MNYHLLSAQLKSLLEGEHDTIANLANASAALHSNLSDINWVGFYLVKNGELLLGPFQGNVACVHIAFGKGVCGTAAQQDATQRVENVHEFSGHIACDCASNSEIVIPLHKDGKVVAVLDIDSPSLARFTVEDQKGLEECAKIIESACDWF